jgi:hypothetical protein
MYRGGVNKQGHTCKIHNNWVLCTKIDKAQSDAGFCCSIKLHGFHPRNDIFGNFETEFALLLGGFEWNKCQFFIRN